MNALAIIGSTIIGTGLGGLAGLAWPVDGPDDMGFGQGLHAVQGAFIGGLLGVCVGSALFA